MIISNEEFAHMRNVFMPIDRDKPNLPFSEFITESGLHDIAKSTKHSNSFFAKYSIPRNSGVVDVSVISGNMFYCKLTAPYEVMVDSDNDPQGYMTDEQLMILLAKLVAGGDLNE